MSQLSTLALCLLATTACTAAATKLTVLDNDDGAAIRSSQCQMLTTQQVSSLPTNFGRQNVCFYGTLYADSEYTVVFPSDGSAKPKQWGVTVMLPNDPNRNLQKFNDRRVAVIGDIKYDHDCWAGALKSNEQRICTPAEHPIYLSNGTIVLTK